MIMKAKYLYTPLLLAVILCSMSSCLKNQTDYFDTSAAERLQKVLTDMKDTLCHPLHGWRMEYFIGNVDQDRGGRNITLEFYPNSDSVRIKSEENKDTAITSWFKLTTDDGPVLAFDTYNELFHKYAVPSSSYYEARGGDFEFIILTYSQKKIVLKGKRSGKISTMYPLEEPADDFIDALSNASKNFYVSSFNGVIGGKNVIGDFDVRNHQFTIEEVLNEDDDKVDPEKEVIPYLITKTGIQFYEPVEFLGTTFTEMSYNPADTSFTAPGLTNGKGYIPDDWRPYDFFPGKYVMTYDSGSVSIEVSAYGDNEESFLVTGLSDYFDVFFDYDIRTGRMTLGAQIVPEKGKETAYKEGKNAIILVPLSTNSFFGTDSENGMCARWNKSESAPRYTWEDKGITPRFVTETYYLRLYNGGFVRDEDGYTVSPKEACFKGNKMTFTPKSMSKFSQ